MSTDADPGSAGEDADHENARQNVVTVDADDTNALNALITKARELDEVVSTKTRLILNERLG